MAKNFLLQKAQSNKGKFDATVDVAKNTIQDIKQLITNPGEVLDNLAYAVTHPVQTAKSTGKAIKDSFEKDVIQGNEYSRAYWGTKATLNTATAIVGTKGIGSVAKVGKLPDAPKANVPKVTPNTNSQANKVAGNLKNEVLSKVEEVKQQLRQLRTPSYELAG